MSSSPRPEVAVVIPCYKVKAAVLKVIDSIGPEVDVIICVDDCCPDGSGQFILDHTTSPRVRVLFHDVNKGVGGAMLTGYQEAVALGARVVVKVDGDGQMDPALIPRFIGPILRGEADYTKGNRFNRLEDVASMPPVRLFGNAVLSFMSKLSSGYWTLFDPTNGYTAIHTAVLRELPLNRIANRYFFESDMLFHLGCVRAVVCDIPMTAVYGDEVSNLHIRQIVGPFLAGHLRNFSRRIFYNYFLRDFHAASVELVLGLLLTVFGLGLGLEAWISGQISGTPSLPGTVVLVAMSLLAGLQMLLAALNFDIQAVPKTPLHPRLETDRNGSD